MPIRAISSGNSIAGYPVKTGSPSDGDMLSFNATTGKWEYSTLVTAAGGLILPTSDPLVAGAWWDNAGTLTKSTGA